MSAKNAKTELQTIRIELKNSADPGSKDSFERFFKEHVTYYGVKTGRVTKIAAEHWKEVKTFEKNVIFAFCEELLKSDYCEEAFIVAHWMPKLKNQFEKGDLMIFKSWIDKYINNWAKCDSFCNHTIGDFIERFPECIKEIITWTHSTNRWMKRASAVSLILPARHGDFLSEIFIIADTLLLDPDDMVQKGYGWMLKEASRKHQKEVFDYVVRHKKTMPRTALRYAIELMPENLRKVAMKKYRTLSC